MSIPDLVEGWGGRRFLITLGCGFVTSLLQYLGKLDPAGSTYAIVIVGTVGAYIGGNTYQKVKDASNIPSGV
jgi:xanthosine utilization system XapX-like protein